MRFRPMEFDHDSVRLKLLSATSTTSTASDCGDSMRTALLFINKHIRQHVKSLHAVDRTDARHFHVTEHISAKNQDDMLSVIFKTIFSVGIEEIAKRVKESQRLQSARVATPDCCNHRRRHMVAALRAPTRPRYSPSAHSTSQRRRKIQ